MFLKAHAPVRRGPMRMEDVVPIVLRERGVPYELADVMHIARMADGLTGDVAIDAIEAGIEALELSHTERQIAYHAAELTRLTLRRGALV